MRGFSARISVDGIQLYRMGRRDAMKGSIFPGI
jgi:hypothetical protein